MLDNKRYITSYLTNTYDHKSTSLLKTGLKKVIGSALITLMFIGVFAFEAKALSITAQPPSMDLIVNPAGVRTFSIEVANTSSDNTQKLKVYAETINIGPTGEIDFISLENEPDSAASWISVGKKSFSLRPMKTRKIPLRLRPPAGIESGGYYVAIIVEPDLKGRITDKGLYVAFRLASIVRITVRGKEPLEKKIEIDDFYYIKGRFNPQQLSEKDKNSAIGRIADEFPNTKGLFLVALLSNSGNIHVKTKASALISTEDKKRIEEVKLKGGTGIVYPDSGRYFVGQLKRNLVVGDYVAQLRLRYRGTKATVEERLFSIDVDQKDEPKDSGSFSAFEIEPDAIDIELSAGAFRTMKFSILNNLTTHLKLKAKVSSDIKNWVELIEPEFLALSGKEKDVILRMDIPTKAKAGSYSGIISITSEEENIEKDIKVEISIRE
jgi:hypothetical protein